MIECNECDGILSFLVDNEARLCCTVKYVGWTAEVPFREALFTVRQRLVSVDYSSRYYVKLLSFRRGDNEEGWM